MSTHISNWNTISKHNTLQEKIMRSSLTTALLRLSNFMFKAINFTKKGFLLHLLAEDRLGKIKIYITLFTGINLIYPK